MTHPLVSICVATNRPKFAHWLRDQFEHLTYPNVELVVATDFPHEHDAEIISPDGKQKYFNVRAIEPDREKWTAGMLFDFACKRSKGHYVAFRSDDFWWHPQSITWLVAKYIEDAGPRTPFVGYDNGWFVKLPALGHEYRLLTAWPALHFHGGVPIVATSLFNGDIARSVGWGPQRKASDTFWQRKVARQWGEGLVLQPHARRFPHHLWLCHGENLNDRGYKFNANLADLAASFDTETKLLLTTELYRLMEDFRLETPAEQANA